MKASARKGVVNPRFVLALACLGLPACFLFEPRPAANVLVIAVDSLRADAISQSRGAAETPNLHKLADDGLTYRWCFAHASSTLPAHAAILSSQLPASSGVRNDSQSIDATVPLLTKHLADEGWQTFVDVAADELEPVAKGEGLDRGASSFQAHGTSTHADEVAAHVIPLIERASRDKPWFAYVNFADPSTSELPESTTGPTVEVVFDGVPIGKAYTNDAGDWVEERELEPGAHRVEFRSTTPFNVRRLNVSTSSRWIKPAIEDGRMLTPINRIVATFVNDLEGPATFRIEARVRGVQSLEQTRARYKQDVEQVDRAVGAIIAMLEKNKLYEDTLIVVTGSHGEALGEHGITGHDVSLFGEMLRVPLVLKPTAKEKRRAELGQTQFLLVRQIDIAPTILELVGESPLKGGEGRSLLHPGDRELQAETHPPEAPGTQCLIRDDRYTMIYLADDDRYEMYDVKSDTLEMENVFTLQAQFRSRWQTELRALAQRSPPIATPNVRPAAKPVAARQDPQPKPRR
jgi:arylsulfatase A-like enzyme